jgi:hypothetical protein
VCYPAAVAVFRLYGLGPAKNPGFPPESFDAVLLDAPCTALGLRPRLLQQHRLSLLLDTAAYQVRGAAAAVTGACGNHDALLGLAIVTVATDIAVLPNGSGMQDATGARTSMHLQRSAMLSCRQEQQDSASLQLSWNILCAPCMLIARADCTLFMMCSTSSCHPLLFCAVQRALLAAAVQLVKPGGVLVYSTCTISPGA